MNFIVSSEVDSLPESVFYLLDGNYPLSLVPALEHPGVDIRKLENLTIIF